MVCLGLGLQAYPKNIKRVNPPTLSGSSVGRATAVGRLAVVTVLLAGVATGRATAAGTLATSTIALAASAVGRATTVATLTTPRVLSGVATGRAATLARLTTGQALAGIATGRATTVAKLVMPRLLTGIAIGRATTVGKFPTITSHLLAGIATGRVTTVGALTAGAATFSPTSIPGLQLWFDASQITGKVDGDVMPSWSDLSGNARDAAQATAAKQPLYKTAIQNGKPVVRFDGVDDFMQTASTFTINQPNTIIMAAFNRAPTATLKMIQDGAVSGARQTLRRQSTQYSMYAGGVYVTQPGTSVPAWDVLTMVMNGASSALYSGGVSILTGNPGTGGLQGVTLAANYVGTEAGNHDIAEYLSYNSALSTADRQAVERYLGTKWGVAVA